MNIGFVYDLRADYLALGHGEEATAEFDAPETIAAIEGALQRLGHTVDRIGHVRSLAARLVAGERWDLVFNIAEGLRGRSREAQVPALLEAFDQPYTFSDPLACALTLDKAMAKRVLRDHGIATAPFVAGGPATRAADLAGLPTPLFVKPLAEGTGKGIDARSRVASAEAAAALCREIASRHAQPALVESFLPGREFTVGILGTGAAAEAVAVLEIGFRDTAETAAYSFVNKEDFEHRVTLRLATDTEARQAAATALAAWRALECRDAGRVDLRSDAAGVPHVLEANPLAGLRPGHSDLPILCEMAGMSFDALIERIVAATCHRIAGTAAEAWATASPRAA